MKWGWILALVVLAGVSASMFNFADGAELRLSAGAKLRLSDRVAPPGTRIRLRVQRLTPNRTATVTFGGRRLRGARTGRRGGLRTAIRVPARRPGVYKVAARTGRRSARVRFRIPAPPVLPTPPVQQAAAPPVLPPPPVQQPVAPPPAPDPVTMIAAGDIACSPTDSFNGAANRCRHSQVSDRVLALNPDVVATLGDTQYEFGRASEFAAVYDPSWGRFRSKTRPAVGNHEYEAPETPNRDVAPGYFGYFGPAAGEPDEGYYTYEIGDWQAIVLNTGALAFTRRADNSLPNDCHPVSCAAGSDQELWLRGVLDSLAPDKCVVAYWHHPRYSSTNPFDHPELTAVYDALRDGGVELALTGHSHYYERFVPMDANDNPDPEFGVREFVVGTGGKDRRFAEPATFKPGSAFHLPNSAGFGVLELELEAQSYEFRFVGEDGVLRDQGSGQCHGRPAP